METLERIGHSLIWGSVLIGMLIILKDCSSNSQTHITECMKMGKTGDECIRLFHN